MKKKGLSKTFFLLFFLAAVYFVLYILLTYHESYFAVGACGVILLTAGYLFISELEKERREKEEEEYERAECKSFAGFALITFIFVLYKTDLKG